jgi:hypothetical protein
MRIGIELNGVLRDTLKKIQEVYQKWYIDNPFLEENEDGFTYEIISEVTTLDLKNHLKFRDNQEIYDFLYKEYTMEIFGHAGSQENSSMMDLNDFYFDLREDYDIWIVSDEIGKSKPASLFFVSKFGCLIENYKFYSETTINSMWDTIDILLTANPTLLLNHPKDKIVIKYETVYNQDINKELSIKSIKELKEKIKKISYVEHIGGTLLH